MNDGWNTEWPNDEYTSTDVVDVTYSDGSMGTASVLDVRNDLGWPEPSGDRVKVIAWSPLKTPYQPPPPEPDTSVPACVARFMAIWNDATSSHQMFSGQNQRDLDAMCDAAMKWAELARVEERDDV